MADKPEQTSVSNNKIECRLCKDLVAEDKHFDDKDFYCPTCGLEIDYILSAEKEKFPPEKIAEIKKFRDRSWRAYILPVAFYSVIWFCLIYFLAQNKGLTYFR